MLEPKRLSLTELEKICHKDRLIMETLRAAGIESQLILSGIFFTFPEKGSQAIPSGETKNYYSIELLKEGYDSSYFVHKQCNVGNLVTSQPFLDSEIYLKLQKNPTLIKTPIFVFPGFTDYTTSNLVIIVGNGRANEIYQRALSGYLRGGVDYKTAKEYALTEKVEVICCTHPTFLGRYTGKIDHSFKRVTNLKFEKPFADIVLKTIP